MKVRTVWITIALLLCACGFRAVRGSGNLITESRNVRDFDRVSLTSSGEVVITQGDREALTIETDDNVMRYVTTEVRGGTLTLGTESGKFISATRLRFSLTVEDLAALRISGSGDIAVEPLDTDSLEITVTGSGDMQIDSLSAEEVQVRISGSGDVEIDSLTAEEVEVRITGSGDVELAGEVTGQEITITGSGEVQGGDLRSETVEVTITGSGDATVWATESLDARITGSGSVSHYGNPVTSVSASGSGKVNGLGER